MNNLIRILLNKMNHYYMFFIYSAFHGTAMHIFSQLWLFKQLYSYRNKDMSLSEMTNMDMKLLNKYIENLNHDIPREEQWKYIKGIIRILTKYGMQHSLWYSEENVIGSDYPDTLLLINECEFTKSYSKNRFHTENLMRLFPIESTPGFLKMKANIIFNLNNGTDKSIMTRDINMDHSVTITGEYDLFHRVYEWAKKSPLMRRFNRDIPYDEILIHSALRIMFDFYRKHCFDFIIIQAAELVKTKWDSDESTIYNKTFHTLYNMMIEFEESVKIALHSLFYNIHGRSKERIDDNDKFQQLLIKNAKKGLHMKETIDFFTKTIYQQLIQDMKSEFERVKKVRNIMKKVATGKVKPIINLDNEFMDFEYKSGLSIPDLNPPEPDSDY